MYTQSAHSYYLPYLITSQTSANAVGKAFFSRQPRWAACVPTLVSVPILLQVHVGLSQWRLPLEGHLHTKGTIRWRISVQGTSAADMEGTWKSKAGAFCVLQKNSSDVLYYQVFGKNICLFGRLFLHEKTSFFESQFCKPSAGCVVALALIRFR